jgi:hypothetical protein
MAGEARISEVLAGGQAVEAALESAVKDTAPSNVVQLNRWHGKNVSIAEKVALRDMEDAAHDQLEDIYAA